jgi:two-component system response regulator YesN
MLTALEHDVATAKSGREALQKIEALQPDVVFTDLSMPEMDGWQLAREIRRQHENTKIVLVTGYGSGIQPNENGERNLVDSIIGKPFDFAKLTETLTKINN